MLELNQLLTPLSLEEFKQQYQFKKPLHQSAASDRFDSVMSWDILNALLNQTGIWTDTNLKLANDGQLIDSALFCDEITGREQTPVKQPVAEKVMQLMSQGASLIADSVENLNPALSLLSDSIEKTLNTKVQCNLYCSVNSRPALDSHFDTHDVYVLHCEGEKVWNIYEGRVDNPVNHPAYKSVTKSEHKQRRGKLLRQVTLKPGDFLYLPRGQYHDALASTSASLHVTFGVTHVVGLDILQLLAATSVASPFFRSEAPPHYADEAEHQQYLSNLQQQLTDWIKKPEFIADYRSYLDGFYYQRGGFKLPVEIKDKRYAKTASDVKIISTANGAELSWSKGVAAIPPDKTELISWMVKTNSFSRSEALSQFGNREAQEIDGLINDLIRMMVIKQIS